MENQAKRLIRGRQPVANGEETIYFSMRMTKAQRGKLRRLGGAKWVRRMIDLSPDVEKYLRKGLLDDEHVMRVRLLISVAPDGDDEER